MNQPKQSRQISRHRVAKQKSQKSLGQVAYEAWNNETLMNWTWDEITDRSQHDWSNVARAVVREYEKRRWSKAASGDGSTWRVAHLTKKQIKSFGFDGHVPIKTATWSSSGLTEQDEQWERGKRCNPLRRKQGG